jgi:deoxyuridine 5'-triphosphate nucleotidohydrolase
MLKFKVHSDESYEHEPVLPQKAGIDEVGFDLTCIKKCKDLTKTPGKVVMYDTGISVQPPLGYYTTIVPRSSIVKSGYMLANSIGVIDPTYRGTLRIVLVKIDENADELELPFCKCQLILNKFENNIQTKQVETLDVSVRGTGGFGSTGDVNTNLSNAPVVTPGVTRSCNIIILRHAEREESDASIKSYLNEIGLKTAKNLPYKLPHNNCAIFTSPYVRCVQTVQKFHKGFNIDLNLREFHDDQNVSLNDILTELNEKYKDSFSTIFSHKYNTVAKEYDASVLETEDQMKERCLEFKQKIEKIIKNDELENVIICTHGSITEELIRLFQNEEGGFLNMGEFRCIKYDF